MPNMKAPLPLIKDRGQKTFLVMNQLLPVYQAPYFISPNNFDGQVAGVTTQEGVLGMKEAAQSTAAGDLDGALATVHDESVLTLKMGRSYFFPTTKAPAWRTLSANGGGRDRIYSEGKDIAEAWEMSDALWMPGQGKSLGNFQSLLAAAVLKFKAHATAETLADEERGILWSKADHVWDLCVQWYEAATAAFAADTPQGYLIRTIPTGYNPAEAPGQLHFTQHFSPAPNQVNSAAPGILA